MSRKSAPEKHGRPQAIAAARPRESWADRLAQMQVPGFAPEENATLLLLTALSLVLVWSYWNTLCEVAANWENPLYSHGYLVPAFAAVLVWVRRQKLRPAEMSARWAGLALLAAGLVMRLVSTRFGLVTPEMISFVPSLAGVVLLAGGWSLFRWAGPSVAFLVFMFPLPSIIRDQILVRLQYLATACSTYVLQTLGVAAYFEGNRISIGEQQMGVVEACSGLRMATNLVALVVAVLIITYRPWWQKIVVLVSAIPIAIAVNVVRITATALVHMASDSPDVGETFHNLAGLAMMPLGLGLLALEMLVLKHLLWEEDVDDPELAAAGIGIRPAANR